MSLFVKSAGGLVAVLLAAGGVASYHTTLTSTVGAPGEAMQVTESRQRLAEKVEANEVPPALPAAAPGGQLAVDAYKNVQVLGYLTSGELTRLMTAMTLWVAPNDGCVYCHAPARDPKGNIVRSADGTPQADLANMGSDEVYAKRVARRMLQMTQHINGDWKQHVAGTGVTCFTCHRGSPVPKYVWFDEPESGTDEGMVGAKAHQNAPAAVAGLTSLPSNALRTFLAGNDEDSIRVQAQSEIGSEDRSSVKQTEWTYSLMIHFSESLGVNCTFCHNSRQWTDWSQSPAVRATAWYGIRMVRDLNHHYVEPLSDVLPAERHGPTGDGPKVSCATCHQGAYKPLLGVSMLADYTALAEARAQPPKSPPPAPVPPPEPLAAGIDGGAVTKGDSGAPAAAIPAAADAGPSKAPIDGGIRNPR
jgi:photosynthetic reaction center cytochrome c subunit